MWCHCKIVERGRTLRTTLRCFHLLNYMYTWRDEDLRVEMCAYGSISDSIEEVCAGFSFFLHLNNITPAPMKILWFACFFYFGYCKIGLSTGLVYLQNCSIASYQDTVSCKDSGLDSKFVFNIEEQRNASVLIFFLYKQFGEIGYWWNCQTVFVDKRKKHFLVRLFKFKVGCTFLCIVCCALDTFQTWQR